MTQHPSLKGSQKDGKFRSVLKRYEKIKDLSDKEKWEEEKDSVYRLPKIKRVKFKVKKVKAAEEEKTGEAEGAVAAAPGAAGQKDAGSAAKKAPAAQKGAPAKKGGKK